MVSSPRLAAPSLVSSSLPLLSLSTHPANLSSGSAGKDVANACAQLPNGGDVIVVGYRVVSSVARRSITKLGISTGAEAWTATDFGDAAGSHGAWEGIDFTAADNSAVIGGFYAKDSYDEMSFRSYGNSGASAVVVKLPVSALESSTVPTSSSLTWTWTETNHGTAKAMRPFASGDIAVLLWTDGVGASTSAIAKLSSSGTTT